MQKTIVSVEYVEQYIEELIACEVLELLPNVTRERLDVYIPYMMNDAVEFVFVLEDCKIQGELPTEIPEDTDVRAVNRENDRHGFVFRMHNEHTVTIWFEKCLQQKTFYQYHRIGHFWKKGQEQWRQLVYMIGTIFDKYIYLGEESCNEEEQQLMWLITFAPFRFWSPVNEDLESRYPDSLQGVNCMTELAEEAGDRRYRQMVQRYRWLMIHSRSNRVTAFYEKRLASALNDPRRANLYQLIYDKVQYASKQYECRDYGAEQNQQIEQQRKEVERNLNEQGFLGAYPEFARGHTKILAVEEHPFTCLEWEDFTFRIQLMVSVTKKKEKGVNRGFFKGRGRKGSIILNDDECLFIK